MVTGRGLVLGAEVLVTVVAATAVTAGVSHHRTAVTNVNIVADSTKQGGTPDDTKQPDVNVVAGAGRQWANSTQFMEIQSGQARDSRVYLKVRPAKKRILGEGFETVPVPGPYTEVTVNQNARILYLDGESGTAEAFVTALANRHNRLEGFDLTFDGQARVTQVDWLYVM